MAAVSKKSVFALARLSTSILNPAKTARAFSVCPALRAEAKKTTSSPTVMKKVSLEELEKTDSELDRDRRMKGLIEVEGPNEIFVASGVPEQHIKERYVRIYRPAKNAMQSGTHGIKRWRIEFETRQRWENNLMGWASTGDPLSNMQVDFANKEEAIAFVEKNGWDYFVEEAAEKTPKAKSYALNFAWNKRTRKSTK